MHLRFQITVISKSYYHAFLCIFLYCRQESLKKLRSTTKGSFFYLILFKLGRPDIHFKPLVYLHFADESDIRRNKHYMKALPFIPNKAEYRLKPYCLLPGTDMFSTIRKDWT